MNRCDNGKCGIPLFILGLLLVFILIIALLAWYAIDWVSYTVASNPITGAALTVADLGRVINQYVRSGLEYSGGKITYDNLSKRIDSYTEELKIILGKYLNVEIVDAHSSLFKAKFVELADLIRDGKNSPSRRLQQINKKIASTMFPSLAKDITRYLNNLDSIVLEGVDKLSDKLEEDEIINTMLGSDVTLSGHIL